MLPCHLPTKIGVKALIYLPLIFYQAICLDKGLRLLDGQAELDHRWPPPKGMETSFHQFTTCWLPTMAVHDLLCHHLKNWMIPLGEVEHDLQQDIVTCKILALMDESNVNFQERTLISVESPRTFPYRAGKWETDSRRVLKLLGSSKTRYIKC